MARRMLIDASHPEETRVVVIDKDALEAFDYESENRKQLKGNIYLAKVTRVEPSLQAAFIEYGGNRHGFLAFNEIHPDYYQIPVSDRERLIAEGAEVEENIEDESGEAVETVGGDDSDEMARPRLGSYRNYKIQEVIKRRQILLVQVTKEERGNKGSALTTYISLAGRYCVLMPNTARGGGISRKIASTTDRKRLKKILDGLQIPEGMAVIVRTAGAERTKAEITRDGAYLLKLWDEIRNNTLESKAPSLINEEANLIKRSIRDLYSKEISEILVEGEDGYRLAKDFMRMLVPSHAKNVKSYKDARIPLFYKFAIEKQLDDIHDPVVRLKSGGYLVINPTEALVAIDVNSGKATRERHIEETALKTNQEAADEVARQLRLRDLAGLIVIDFIDMDVSRNIHTVERRLKNAMRADRARIQVGRISPFGLLEMSRQRLRPSLTEASSEICEHCNGIGYVRTVPASALHALRAAEEESLSSNARDFTLYVAAPIALYILNKKRPTLAEIENQHGINIEVVGDETLNPPAFRIEHEPSEGRRKVMTSAAAESTFSQPKTIEGDSGEKVVQKRRPRRRARAGRGAHNEPVVSETQVANVEGGEQPTEEVSGSGTTVTPKAGESEGSTDEPRKRRRRGRRGGRRRSKRTQVDQEVVASPVTSDLQTGDHEATETEIQETPVDTAIEGVGKKLAVKRRRPTRRKPNALTSRVNGNNVVSETPESAEANSGVDTVSDDAGVNAIAKASGKVDDSKVTLPNALPAKTESDTKPARRGWWRRAIS